MVSVSTIAIVKADVGNFNDYGDSGGGSNRPSGESSGESSFDSDGIFFLLYYLDQPVVIIVGLSVVLLVTVAGGVKIKKKKITNLTNNFNNDFQDKPTQIFNKNIEADAFFGNLQDADFSSEKFSSFAEYVFVKMQDAWSERDWKLIRPYESDNLFEKHKNQLDWYIKNNQINKMDRVCVNNSFIMNFYQTDSDDVLEIFVDAKFNDYIIDEATGKVLKGDPNKLTYMKYKLTFVRSKGVKTGQLIGKTNTLTCPNCKANVDITANGKCEYCDAIIVSKSNNWVLNDIDNIIQ